MWPPLLAHRRVQTTYAKATFAMTYCAYSYLTLYDLGMDTRLLPCAGSLNLVISEGTGSPAVIATCGINERDR